MKVAIVVLALVAASQAGVIAPALVAPAVLPATTLVRSPSHDSAIIQSDRLGGNFAYSSVEAPAYAAVSPVVQNVVSQVGVSYHATPVATPVNVVQQYVAPQYIAGPQVIAAPQFLPGQIQYIPQQIIPSFTGIPAPVVPGIVAPSFPIDPSGNLIPAAPVDPATAPASEEKPAEESQEALPIAAEQPEAPQAPQADAPVSVEAV